MDSDALAMMWGFTLLSFLTIILAATMLMVERRLVAIGMILCAVVAGTLGAIKVEEIALGMILVIIGGILALFGRQKKPAA